MSAVIIAYQGESFMFIYPISLTIAAGAALLNCWLMMRVGKVRGEENVMIGDGGNERVIRRMRAHSNFIESAPFVLILLFLLEAALGSAIGLWAVGAIYLVGRAAHAIGMDGPKGPRIAGAVITLLTLLGLALTALYVVYSGASTTTTTELVAAAPISQPI